MVHQIDTRSQPCRSTLHAQDQPRRPVLDTGLGFYRRAKESLTPCQARGDVGGEEHSRLTPPSRIRRCTQYIRIAQNLPRMEQPRFHRILRAMREL